SLIRRVVLPSTLKQNSGYSQCLHRWLDDRHSDIRRKIAEITQASVGTLRTTTFSNKSSPSADRKNI
ncbi:hypothetical protein, partial [[Limnothrix rosea] IAM M-220]|uniref:hypothetical protein n=1 Tax=[Limnothrix rosea] IAM M-220 TaxID=454133 RepID=UPI001C0B9FCC